MTDPQNIMPPPARQQIDLDDDASVREWALHLAVSEVELREAVDVVGASPESVRQYLRIG